MSYLQVCVRVCVVEMGGVMSEQHVHMSAVCEQSDCSDLSIRRDMNMTQGGVEFVQTHTHTQGH